MGNLSPMQLQRFDARFHILEAIFPLAQKARPLFEENIKWRDSKDERAWVIGSNWEDELNFMAAEIREFDLKIKKFFQENSATPQQKADLSLWIQNGSEEMRKIWRRFMMKYISNFEYQCRAFEDEIYEAFAKQNGNFRDERKTYFRLLGIVSDCARDYHKLYMLSLFDNEELQSPKQEDYLTTCISNLREKTLDKLSTAIDKLRTSFFRHNEIRNNVFSFWLLGSTFVLSVLALILSIYGILLQHQQTQLLKEQLNSVTKMEVVSPITIQRAPR